MGTSVTTERAKALATGRVQALLDAAGVWAEEHGLDSAEDAVFAAVEELGALGKVGRRFGVTRAAVQAWLRTDPERLRPLLAEARRAAGEARAEDAGDHFDDLPEDPSTAQVQVAREKSNYDRWLAGVWNKDYADQRGASVEINVSVGQLHLDALRAEGARRAPVAVAEVMAPGAGDGGPPVELADDWEDAEA